ncbi:hypothetical protein BN946_scf184787.g24 [Trametes cinnabarina]|uniref:DUF6818 domain-containing protein n=1 Tax=Pycnoporus cinnabarinus TaxID=5643 RepID=A0A060SSP2_PYCCI|nr:hypothetical protein BN946_scf184787.g24 [Trametes cinnabarina]
MNKTPQDTSDMVISPRNVGGHSSMGLTAPAVSQSSASAPPVAASGRRKPETSAQHTGGRQQGSSNYTDADIWNLLDSVREVLPMSPDAWQDVANRFNARAEDQGRPKREVRPLRLKYDAQLVREASKKPTGKTRMPRHLRRVLRIERKINTKSHVGELDDDEPPTGTESSVDEDTGGSGVDDLSAQEDGDIQPDVEIVEPSRASPSQPAPKAARNPAAMSTQCPRRAVAHDFLNILAASLDPAARETREQMCFVLKMAQEQIHGLTQENRELRNRNDTLTDRIQQLSNELQEQKAEVKALCTRLEMYEMFMPYSRFPGPLHWPNGTFAPPQDRNDSNPPSIFPSMPYTPPSAP